MLAYGGSEWLQASQQTFAKKNYVAYARGQHRYSMYFVKQVLMLILICFWINSVSNLCTLRVKLSVDSAIYGVKEPMDFSLMLTFSYVQSTVDKIRCNLSLTCH